MASLIGNKPNQVPTNGDLGKLAFMDVVDTVSNNPYYDTAISDVQPTLNLDFVNSKTLDPRITFARASTATYYDGKSSAVAEQNLLLQSQAAFNTGSWAKTNLTVGASTTAPDGTTTAQLIYPTATGASASNYQPGNFASGIYTLSIYAQAASQTYFAFLQPNNIGSGAAWFNLSAGTVGTVSGGYTATIAQVGSTTWYRCTITLISAMSGVFAFTPCDGNGSLAVTNSGTNGVNFWGAQLEQRSSATAYNRTTTTALTNYIPTLQTASNNVARLDYNPVTGTPNGLLIEESRTNLLTYSQLFSSWSATNNITLTSSANIAPDGTQSAGLVTVTTAAGNHNIINNTGGITVALSPLTATFYVKAGTSSIVGIDLKHNDATQGRAYFNLSTLSATVLFGTSTSTSITAVGNGWYRCSFTATPSSTTQSFALYVCNASGAFSYTGAGESAFFADCQLEQGAFPTSYIPTVASQVTRSADSASMTGTNFSSWYNNSQGCFYAEASYLNATNSGQPSLLGSSTGYNLLYPLAGSPNNWINYDGANNSYASTSVALNSNNKLAFSYGNSQKQTMANGGTGSGLGNYNNIYSAMTALYIGGNSGGGQNYRIKKLQYYPQALSNAELQELTA